MAVRQTKTRRRIEAIRAAVHAARHIAIVRLGSIGDVVATLPLVWFLRDLLGPEVRISWIVHEAAAELLRGVPAIDDIVSLPKGSLIEAVPSWKRILARRGIDTVLDVHGNLKSGVVGRLSGAARRVGFHRRDCREHWNPLFTNLKLPRLASNNKTRRAIEIAALLGLREPQPRFGLQFDALETDRARQVLRTAEGDRRPLAVLQLGRLEDIRSWPPEHYAGLAERLRAGDYGVLVIGGPPEEESGEAVRALLAGGVDGVRFEINTLSLREVGALLALLAAAEGGRHVFVGGDSGCLHLAAACGLRSVGLFGPQDPQRTAPVGTHIETLYHPEVATCIPCARRECFHPTWSFCMKSISPEEVARRVVGREAGREPAGEPLSAAAREPAAPRQLDAQASAPGGEEPPRGRSHLRGEFLWTLLLAAALMVVRASSSGELLEAGRFPGLSLIVDADGPFGRITSVVAGVGLVLVTALTGWRLGTAATGLLAASLLLSTGLCFDLARSAPAVGLFACLVSGSSLLFLQGEVRAGAWRRWGGALATLAAFGAFLVHGLLGIVLPALSLVAFRAGEKALGKLLRPSTLLFSVLVATGAAGWFLTVGETRAFFEPFVVPQASGAGAEPLWAYAAWLAAGGLPASVLAPFALYAHLKNRRYREDLGFADRRWRYAKSAFLSGFTLLSLLPAKDSLYLHALLPALSVLSAAWLEKRWETWRAGPSGAVRARLVSWLVLAAGAFTVGGLCAFGRLREEPLAAAVLVALFLISWAVARSRDAASPTGLALRLATIAVVTAAAVS